MNSPSVSAAPEIRRRRGSNVALTQDELRAASVTQTTAAHPKSVAAAAITNAALAAAMPA